LRIVQISDLHLDDFLASKFSVDTKANFDSIFKRIDKSSTDLLVLTGDLGNSDFHKYIIGMASEVRLPLAVTLGNHDNITECINSGIIDSINVRNSEYYHSIVLENYLLLFLDSSSGSFSDHQLNWLFEKLSNATGYIIVFTHHPILDCAYSLDRYFGLANRKDIEAILVNSDREIYIFCGHYHCPSQSTLGKIKQYVCPSTIMQIRATDDSLVTDSFDYGFHTILATENLVTVDMEIIKSGRIVQEYE
jgi:Icc protein